MRWRYGDLYADSRVRTVLTLDADVRTRMLSCGCPRSEACAWMFDLPVLAKGSHNWKNFLLSLPHAPWPDGEASRTDA